MRKLLLAKTESTAIQLFRYTFVGGFAFVIDFGLLFSLTEYLKVYYLIAAAISFSVGVFVNYFLSVTWVFSAHSLSSKTAEFTIFVLIGIGGLGLNELFIWLFTSVCGIYYLMSKLMSTVFVYLWNFFARKYLLFQ